VRLHAGPRATFENVNGPVLPADLRAAIATYAKRLSSRFGNRLRFVRLFGSWARSEAGEDSDVDVAVVVDGLTCDEWRDAVSDAVDVELETGATLSPFVVASDHFDLLVRRERRIARDILEEGMDA
jgi:predicted nucleotidyltransferase